MTDALRYPVPAARWAYVAGAPGSTARVGLNEELVTHERVEFVLLTVVLGYPHISAVLHLLPSFEATLAAERFGEDITLGLRLPRQHDAALRAALANATQGTAIFVDDHPVVP